MPQAVDSEIEADFSDKYLEDNDLDLTLDGELCVSMTERPLLKNKQHDEKLEQSELLNETCVCSDKTESNSSDNLSLNRKEISKSQQGRLLVSFRLKVMHIFSRCF